MDKSLTQAYGLALHLTTPIGKLDKKKPPTAERAEGNE